MMLKRILVFGITDNPGGVESVIMNYYRHLDREKVQFDFLCNTNEVAYEKEILELGGRIFRVTARSLDNNQYKKDMRNFFENNAKNYSCIWVNICSLANIDYLRYAKKYGIKHRIIHSHNSNNMDSTLRGILHKVNKIILNYYATEFWSCSNDASKWFYNKGILDRENIRLVNNAVDVERFQYNGDKRNEIRLSMGLDNKLVIGHIGRMHFQKNQEFLIDIFYEIKKKVPDSILILVGQGEDEIKIKEKVEKLDLDDSVKFMGVLSDVENVMQSMDLFIFPSLFEGLPLVLIEAQANGLPIFTSANVISKDVKMSDNLQFIDLNRNAKEWADIVYKTYMEKGLSRTDNKTIIKNNGYDIKYEAKKIQEFFESR